MPKIYKDGTDQYILFRATSSADYTAFTGSTGGEQLPGAIVVISEYKKDDEVIETPVVTWNATIGKWKAAIPAGNVTQYGPGELNVSGTGMITVSIEFETISPCDYNENALEGTYSRVEVERMIAAVLLGNETRVPGTSTFVGLDGATQRVVASLASAGRTITTRDGD